MAKKRGIMRSMCDSGARLMRAGYNKLIEEWKAKQGALKEKKQTSACHYQFWTAINPRIEDASMASKEIDLCDDWACVFV